MSSRSRVWVLGACGLVFTQAAASLIMPQGFKLTAISDFVQCVLLLSGVLALAPNIIAARGRTRLFWALMTFGVALWLFYQLLWTYFEVYRQSDVPNPFVGDVVLFLHIVPMMAALALRPHQRQDERFVRLGSLDFSLLLVFWLYLWLFAVIPWQYITTNEAIYGRNLNALYLTEKIVFLCGLGFLWARCRSSWKPVYAQLFGACLLYGLSSYAANWAIGRNLYYSGSLYDVPLAASMAWYTAAGLFALDSAPRQEPAPPSGTHGVWVARLGMITISFLPIFAAWSVFDPGTSPPVRTFRVTVALATMLVMGFMVFLKQHLLDRELMRLLRSSEKSFEDLQGLQVQLLQSEKLASLGQLVGGAAHEINNPLTAMLGYSDLLASTALAGEQQALAQKIVTQVRHTRALVSSLLGFAKQAPAAKSLLDMNAIVRTALKLSQPQLSARDIEATADLAMHLPLVSGDSNQLLQVCLHIINNGIHAMADAGGTLVMSSHHVDGAVVLEFSDTGPGAPDPERVFDPFYTSRTAGKSTGLGLSACNGIVSEHNGTITCLNRPEGGAMFRIALPVTCKLEHGALRTNTSMPSEIATSAMAARQPS